MTLLVVPRTNIMVANGNLIVLSNNFMGTIDPFGVRFSNMMGINDTFGCSCH